MTRRKSTDPRDRLGVYKTFADVPQRYQFEQYADEYDGRDVWSEFCREHLYQQGSSDSFRSDVDRTGSHWLTHMESRGRHHALADPEDVEAWCRTLTADEDKTISTAYNYWVHVRSFYDWLRWHVDHPHTYDPVLMAAVHGDAAADVWAHKIRKLRNARARYEADG